MAEALIAAYTTLIERAHERGIRVYGATILPFGGSFYDSPEREAARQTVNAWVRTSGAFDAVIDLDAALRDPEAPTRLRPEAVNRLESDETPTLAMIGEQAAIPPFALLDAPFLCVWCT